jgi:hypothetical protein
VIILGIRLCPLPTLPNEPAECEQNRENFAAGSPYVRFDLNFDFYFFNEQRDLQGAINHCNQLGYRQITVNELAGISAQLTAAGLCTMLVWTITNGIPTLAYFVPGGQPVVVPTPSLLCPAYFFCVLNLE